jgi:hypothetical protein
MADHVKTAETLAVSGSGDASSNVAVSNPAQLVAKAGAGAVAIPETDPAKSDRRIHFGITGAAGVPATVTAAADVTAAKGYPGDYEPNYRPFPDPPFDGT